MNEEINEYVNEYINEYMNEYMNDQGPHQREDLAHNEEGSQNVALVRKLTVSSALSVS